MDFTARAKEKFARSEQEIDGDLDAIFASHASKGLLRSGSTIIVSVRAFEDRTRSAMCDLQKEFSAVVENRSGAWRSAMEALDRGLKTQIARAPEILAKAIRVANGDVGPGPVPEKGRAIRAFDHIIRDASTRLAEEQKAFRDGWTSPPGKKWVERHPIQYGLIAAVGGALLGKGADLIYAMFTR